MHFKLIQPGIVHPSQYLSAHFIRLISRDLPLPFFFAARQGLIPETGILNRKFFIGPGHLHDMLIRVQAIVFNKDIGYPESTPVNFCHGEFHLLFLLIQREITELSACLVLTRTPVPLYLPDNEQVAGRRPDIHTGFLTRLHRFPQLYRPVVLRGCRPSGPAIIQLYIPQALHLLSILIFCPGFDDIPSGFQVVSFQPVTGSWLSVLHPYTACGGLFPPPPLLPPFPPRSILGESRPVLLFGDDELVGFLPETLPYQMVG